MMGTKNTMKAHYYTSLIITARKDMLVAVIISSLITKIELGLDALWEGSLV